MPKISYRYKQFRDASLEMINQANEIIEDYQAQGYKLTLRQLYYQFVSRDLLENTVKNYDRLGAIISDGRLAGLIDWEAIEDRTRETVIQSHWASPREILETCAKQFAVDKWEGQERRPEVWVEKEALAGVVERVCMELDVPYLSCRGYTSQSEMWSSAQRIRQQIDEGFLPLILHLGDHDPSGIDMTRDIEDRLELFCGEPVEVLRIALNLDQVKKYKPPPNPAKTTDSRFASYRDRFGIESWELDALPPEVLARLIKKHVLANCDASLYSERKRFELSERKRLSVVADEWEDADGC